MTTSKFLALLIVASCVLSAFACRQSEECYMGYPIDLRRDMLCFRGILRVHCWNKYNLARTVDYVDHGYCFDIDKMFTPCHYVPMSPPVDLKATMCMNENNNEYKYVECGDPDANICTGFYKDQYDQLLQVNLEC